MLCRGALRTITLLRNVAAAAGAVAWAACLLPLLYTAPWLGRTAVGTATLAASSVTYPSWALVAVAAALTAAYLLLDRLRQNFIFVDYVHAHK